jgi:selenocysteine lyase/cysteine desulfurase
MNLNRRQFLATGGTLAAGTLMPGRLLAALESRAQAPPAGMGWDDVRAQFNLSPDHLQFSSFYLVSHPRPVRDAIEDFRRTLDADPFLVVERGMFESETDNMQRRVREDVAAYIGARPDELALTGNTTMGLALVYHGLPLRPGDEVLTTAHDHYSHHESIRLATGRAGASMRKIALFDRPEQATTGAIVQRVREGIRPATRALGVTWVHSSTGVRLPIGPIAEAVREVNRGRDERDRVLLIVDGVHGLGAVDASMADLGCDFFCAGTHKWMFAPRGTGIVWARPEAWAKVRPTIPTFSSLESFEAWMREEVPPGPNTAARMTPGGFTAYEHQWAMGAAFRFHQGLGRRRVAERIRRLNDQCKEGLARTPRVRLHTPRDPGLSAGLACFEVEGMSPEDVVKRLLERRIVASTSPYRVTYARLAPSLVNSPEEVETALKAVRAIAAA